MYRDYSTWIELSRKALLHNVAQLKEIITTTELAVVLKSNAYGHDAHVVASLLDSHPSVSWFCTASLSEAISLRKNGIKKPLIVLSYLDGSYEEAIAYHIHCSVYTFEDAQRLSAAAQKVGTVVNVHIKVDTGMSRLGIVPEDIVSFIRALQKLPFINLYGIFTHLCDTSNPDQEYSHFQLDSFDKTVSMLEHEGISFACVHAQSSSGLCIETKRKYTLMRAGASVYGLWKTPVHQQLILKQCPLIQLRPVMTWKARIVQIKHIPQGSFIGYDRTYRAEKNMDIAIVPLGYWEGYSRRFSNKGIALINNQPVSVAGIVSMNLTAFDITGLNISPLDEVTLLGPDPITASSCAQRAGIITNEMVTGINHRIPRFVTD